MPTCSLWITAMVLWSNQRPSLPADLVLIGQAMTLCEPCSCMDPMADCSSLGLTSVPSSSLPVSATSLSLRNNSICSLEPGVFSRLASLERLDLSRNCLRYITADLFRGASLLTSLSLAHNDLVLSCGTDRTQKYFSSLASLVQLDLSHNKLRDVNCPLVDHNTADLRWLDLSYNNLSLNAEPRLLRNLGNLTFLDLSHNRLDSLDERLFRDLKSLQSLNMSHNHIPLNRHGYPSNAFETIRRSLTELRLESNLDNGSSGQSYSYPDKLFGELTKLKHLQIDGLSDPFFGSGFEGMEALTNLSLSGEGGGFCWINSLTNTTFVHLPQSLQSLNLSRCNISRIEADAFRPLRRLQTLDLSLNRQLGFARLGDAFHGLQGSDLRELHVNSITDLRAKCVLITSQTTRFFKNTRLEAIHAQHNRLRVIFEGALRNMPNSLRFVNVNENDLGFGSYLKDLGSLENLREIHNDGYNTAHRFPTEYPPDELQQCSSGVLGKKFPVKTSPVEPKTPLDYTGTGAGSFHRGAVVHITAFEKTSVHVAPHLETYVSRWNKIYLQIMEVEFNPNNSLTSLNLCCNLLNTWVGPVKGLTRLLHLDLSFNTASHVSKTFFNSLASLTSLNASNNRLRNILIDDMKGELFAPLRQLQVLDLAYNELNYLPKNVFNGLVSLEKLILSYNMINHFDVDISHMRNLWYLDLAFNTIRFLPKSVTDHLDSLTNFSYNSFNLSHNQLECTCERLQFLIWVEGVSTTQKIACSTPGVREPNISYIATVIDRLRDSCTDTVGIFVGALSCAFCLLVAVLSALVYRYRWKLRYLYYASRLAYRRLQPDRDESFQFDAFVSYSSEDNVFVHGELLEELETWAGLRLNVHNRDFIPGCPIPSNIVSAVQNSRRTLVVLSPELLQSEWCHYEMQMATMEAAHTGRDVLLFLLYEDVPPEQLPRDVLYNLQASTYIQYPGSRAPFARTRDFWARLAQAIRQ